MAFLVLVAVLAMGCAASQDAPSKGSPQARSSSASADSHTVLIVLENHEIGEVVGTSEMPYFNRLIRRGAFAVKHYAVAHPSLPNYLALLGGSTFGIAEDCSACLASGPNLATQLSAASISWRAYMGDMPHSCFTGAESGTYVKRHNPFMYFPSITSNPRLCKEDVPEDQLDKDLAGRDLPSFAWISPDLCLDGHSCPLSVTDKYLHKLVPRLMSQLDPHGLLVITFDEGTSNASCCGNAAGGRIATILLGAGVREGTRLRTVYSHYSLLAALEDRFGLPRLRHARGVEPMPSG